MLTIGKVAEQAGVNVETVRFYERQGILEQPQAPAEGYRVYPEDAPRRIMFIKQAQALGFTLKEISELLALRVDEDSTCEDVRRAARAKLDEIENKINSLKRMKTELVRLVDA